MSTFKYLGLKYLTYFSAKISNDKVTEIFFEIDEFYKVFEPAFTQRLLENDKNTGKEPLKCRLARSLP